MRLGPLLIVCIAAWVIIGWLTGEPIPLGDIVSGLLFPTWPRGTWSITIEMHFYLLFPLLLFMFRRHGPFALLAIVAAAILLRYDWWHTFGEAQHIAYWTIFGRNVLRIVAGLSFASFLVLWNAFDQIGGFYNHTGAPSQSLLWVFIPTVEAVTFGSLIAFYDGTSFRMPVWLDRGLAMIGERSYSIYLLHFFPIVLMRHLFWERTGSPEDFYVALIVATLAFLAFVPVAGLSYTYFEKRFLAYRRPYLDAPAMKPAVVPSH